MTEPTVRLKSPRRTPHPWVWKGMLDPRSLPRSAPPGGVVRVVDPDGRPAGRGFYHPRATIALRILTSEPDEAIDAAFFARRLREALRLRREVLRLEEGSDSFRLVHAESDGLTGLVLDLLGGVLLGEVFSAGMARQAPAIRAALAELLPGVPVVLRGDRRVEEIEGFRLEPRSGDPGGTEVVEHGVRFRVDLRHGHKTGFFLDQRENRVFLGQLARGKEVLDLHCYTGGFSLTALAAGAARTTGVDLDEDAIALAQRNAKLNQQREARFVHADAFAYLRDLQRTGRRFPVVVLDPPKLARDRKELEQALGVYHDLNRLALGVVEDGGVLLTCSCSGVVSEDDLLNALRRAAAKTRKELTVFRISGAAADHPVGLHVPETRYLKAVFARVRDLPGAGLEPSG